MEQPPETAKMEPSAYLRGTWCLLEPFDWDGHSRHQVSLRLPKFTKSRFIEHNAEVLDDGTVHNIWQHPDTWRATADTIANIRHRWIHRAS